MKLLFLGHFAVRFCKPISSTSLFTRCCATFTAPNRPNESVTMKRNRLLYESRKRGNLENGIILSSFAEKYLDKMTQKQLQAYDHLINTPDCDWDLYYWSVGEREAPDEYKSDVLKMLQEHTRNYGREMRSRRYPIGSSTRDPAN